MNIGINARFLTRPYTGIGQYTLRLLRGLAEIDTENHYFLFTPEHVDLDLPANFEPVRVQENFFGSSSISKAYWEHTLVPKEMIQRHVRLAHFPYPSNPWRSLPFPVIVTIHDVIPWVLPEYRKRWRSKLYHFYAGLALGKADHLITVSEFTKHEVLKLFKKVSSRNISVIPNSAPSEAEATIPSAALRRPYFLYVGGYDSRKNVPLLIEVYQKMIAPFYAVDLLLVGGKNQGLESLLTDAYSLKITDKVRLKNPGKIIFTDPMEQDQLHFLYQKALAFVNFSRYEGFNIPLLESLYFGTPAVVSDIPVHHEVAKDAAIFTPCDDITKIGNALEKIIQDKVLRDSLSRKGKEYAESFTLRKHAEKTLDVYNLFN